jgi:hypothetical protein
VTASQPHQPAQASAPADAHDLTTLDDDQLISQRATLRARLGQLSWHDGQRAALEDQYEAFTGEFDRRARAAWKPAETRPPAAPREQSSGPAGQQP